MKQKRKYTKKNKTTKENCSKEQPEDQSVTEKPKRKYTRTPKVTYAPPLFPESKYPLEPRKEQFAPLRNPEHFPNLIHYEEDEDYPFIRNTSRDVMWSSTMSFQESPELQELKETYLRMKTQERSRPQFESSVPLNILFNKVSIGNKMLPRI